MKIKKLDGDYNYFNLILRTWGVFFQKIGKMLKTSMSDYEKSSVVTYPFYFINRQSIHKTNCMQIIKKILMREVFPAIALKICQWVLNVLFLLQIYVCVVIRETSFCLFLTIIKLMLLQH